MSTPYEWRINDIERAAKAAAPAHEVRALREHVARLERSIGELSACCDGLRSTSEALLARIERLEQDPNA